MAAAAHSNRQTVLNRAPQRERNVMFIRAHNNRRGSSIDGGIPHPACVFEGCIFWS
jgi:hypothetical protein